MRPDDGTVELLAPFCRASDPAIAQRVPTEPMKLPLHVEPVWLFGAVTHARSFKLREVRMAAPPIEVASQTVTCVEA